MPKKKSILDGSGLFSGPRSYMSLGYGILTVIIIFVIVFLGIRAISQRDADVTDQALTTEDRVYEVKEGESLWTIAENVYNDGYKWTVIAEANNLDSPDAIETGMKLTIPEISPTEAQESVAEEEIVGEEVVEPTVTMEEKGDVSITGDSYTVVEGDNLWDISVRAYGDGFRWVEIAKANNLVNPDLIYPGDKFTLPR